MANDLMNLIPKNAEELAAFIEAMKTLGGASKAAYSATVRYLGPTIERNWKRVVGKAQELRDNVPPERHSDVPPNIFIPLVDGASQENNGELQDLWAALLANSMIDNNKKVRREYLDVLRQLEPSDAAVLRIIALPLPAMANSSTPINAWHDFRRQKRAEIGLGEDEWHVSIATLAKLGCAYTAHGGAEPTTTPFARLFLAACEVR